MTRLAISRLYRHEHVLDHEEFGVGEQDFDQTDETCFSPLVLAHCPFNLPVYERICDAAWVNFVNRCTHIVRLDWIDGSTLPESFIRELLARPSLRRSVATLQIKLRRTAAQRLSRPIQMALFTLPRLTRLVVDSTSFVQDKLDPLALKHAVHLQRVDIVRGQLGEMLAPLAPVALPSLTHLRLLSTCNGIGFGDREMSAITSTLLSSQWLSRLVRFELRTRASLAVVLPRISQSY